MSDVKDEMRTSKHAETVDNVDVQSTAEPHEMSKVEKRLLLTQDLVITPLLSGAFFFAYLDRAAIGNARLLGFQDAIGIDDSQYYNCLMMFYIGYMVFEFPALLLIKRFHAPTVYAVSVLIFGAAGLCTAYATTYAQVLVLRLILGCGEAVVQTSFVFLSLWYKREELAKRAGYVYATTPIGGAVSGIIAHSVGINLDGRHGIAAWQWLFILEGIPTMAWGLLMWIFLPQVPEDEIQSKRSIFFKVQEERELIIRRSEAAQNVMHGGIKLWQVLEALKDPKTWMMDYIVGTIGMALASFGVFLPTFIREFGFDPITTQLYTIIPYGCAFVALLGVSRLVDWLRMRAWPLLTLVGIAIIGFVILLATTNRVVLVVGACLINVAVYPSIVICAAWIPASNAGYTKRAAAAGLMQIFIQCFSIMSTQIFTSPPRFFKGHGTVLGMLVLCFVFIIVVVFLMKRSNRKKDEAAERWREMGQINPDESKTLEDLCDKHPNYRYIW